MAQAGKPRFFAKPEQFGAWLAKNGARKAELVVGYWKVGTGRPSMTWAQSVEQALVHGWIDGVRRSLGPDSYSIRFTPRRRGSNWSNVNLGTAKRLLEEGRMAPAGRAAFEARDRTQPARGAYEQTKTPRLGAAETRRFKQEPAAWAWFQQAAPSYRRACAWWIQSAKRPETKQRRLEHIIANARTGSVAPEYQWRGGGRKRREGTPAKAAKTGSARTRAPRKAPKRGTASREV